MKTVLFASVVAAMIAAGPGIVAGDVDLAFAKNDKDRGNKPDHAGGPDKAQGQSDRAASKAEAREAREEAKRLRWEAKQAEKAARAEAKLAKAEVKAEAKAAKFEGEKNLSAMLGALNAAHASPQALANASPNSRVGRIAIYKEAAEEAFEALGDVNDAADPLLEAGLTEENLDEYASYDSYDDFVEAVDGRIQDAKDRLAEIEGEDGFDADNPGQEYEDLTKAVEADEELLDLADGNKDDLETYADARDTYDTEAAEAREALENAANKEINDDNYEVISTEVNRLLGIGESAEPASGADAEEEVVEGDADEEVETEVVEADTAAPWLLPATD